MNSTLEKIEVELRIYNKNKSISDFFDRVNLKSVINLFIKLFKNLFAAVVVIDYYNQTFFLFQFCYQYQDIDFYIDL